MGSPAFWPSKQLFQEFLDEAGTKGVGLVFLNNYFEFRYIKEFPYGINLLYYHLHDPSSIGFGYGEGPVYYKVISNHPITEGLGSNGRIYIVNGGDYDYAWFNEWSGRIVALIGSETRGIRGGGIGVKETSYGTRWVLLAGLAPEQWTDIS